MSELTEMVLAVRVSLEPRELVSGRDDLGKLWSFSADQLEIMYEWTPGIGYWRCLRSVATGQARTRHGISSYAWERGQHDKTEWLVALELLHYPKRSSR